MWLISHLAAAVTLFTQVSHRPPSHRRQPPPPSRQCFAQAASPCWARDRETHAPPIQVIFTHKHNTHTQTLLIIIDDTQHNNLSLPAGGGVTLRGSDGQLHPRAPPKPLRVSAVFPNAVPPPPADPDEDPSSCYTELVVQVKQVPDVCFPLSLSVFVSIFTCCCVQVPQSRRRGHVDRLRAEEKWQSRARLTETSFGFLEAQKSDESSLQQQRTAAEEEGDDWHFERPHVCIHDIVFILFLVFMCFCSK